MDDDQICVCETGVCSSQGSDTVHGVRSEKRMIRGKEKGDYAEGRPQIGVKREQNKRLANADSFTLPLFSHRN